MPISDSELARPMHAHVRCPATDSIHGALQVWRSTPASDDSWWLVIEHDTHLYTAIRFSDLYNLLKPLDAPVHLNTRLVDLPYWSKNPNNPTRGLPGVVSPTIVEQHGINMDRVQQLVEENPGNIVVALHNGEFQGILTSRASSTGFAREPLLEMLAQFEAGGDDETIILPRTPLQEDEDTASG